MRQDKGESGRANRPLQFLWELHFIEARVAMEMARDEDVLQFLWELHFIEAASEPTRPCTSTVAVPLGTALH